jgi:hypothetical protein
MDMNNIKQRLSENGLLLKDMPDAVKANREMVLTAVFNDGYALKFASDEMKDDEEVVLTALKTFNLSTKFASDRLKRDIEFIKKAIDIFPAAIGYSIGDMRNDKEIALAAVKKAYVMCKYLPDRMKDDEDVIIEATRQMSISISRYASKRLKEDKNFILKLLNDNKIKKDIIYFLSKKMRNDLDIINIAINNNIKIPTGDYILSLYQIKNFVYASIINKDKKIIATSKEEFKIIDTIYGAEYNAEEIWEKTMLSISKVISLLNINKNSIYAVGISGQFGTTLMWHNSEAYSTTPFIKGNSEYVDKKEMSNIIKKSNTPVGNVLSGNSNHTEKILKDINTSGNLDTIENMTGLKLTNMSGGLKARWIIEHNNLSIEAGRGGVLFSTIESWLAKKISNNEIFAINYASALSTSLFEKERTLWGNNNIDNKDGITLLSFLGSTIDILPEFRPMSEIYGFIRPNSIIDITPISALSLDTMAYRYGEAIINNIDMAEMNKAAVENTEEKNSLLTVELPWEGFGDTEDDINKIALGTAYLAGLTFEFWE